MLKSKTDRVDTRANMRILVVEDDAEVAELVSQGLVKKGHVVDVALDGIKGLEKSQSLPFDAIVLNIMLPRLDGLALTRRLRSGGIDIPILMLAARVPDVMRGLDAGVDDFLIKPFSFEDFDARLAVITRKSLSGPAQTLQVADLTLNVDTHTVRRGHRLCVLTPKEFIVLEHLMRRAGRVVFRDDLIEAAWGIDADIGQNTLEVNIHQLRTKLEFDGDSRLIQTVRGFGYRITTGDETNKDSGAKR